MATTNRPRTDKGIRIGRDVVFSKAFLSLQVPTALEYHKLGWCVIPMKPRTKKPALRSWKKHQAQKPTESQLRQWFANGNKNIAVVLGPVSGDLVCRDFDTMAEYEKWATAYPELANILPTSQTSKGRHIYFQAAIEGIKHIANGELRGKGGYCLLPPSIHPGGSVYQWANPPTNGNLLVVDPKNAGLLPKNGDVTERTDENGGRLKEICAQGEIEEAINRTLPIRFRTRHRRIFCFARALCSMPEHINADPKQFRSVVKVWHKRALPNIRTKEFEETWIDFLKGWKKIKWKIGEKPMAQIFEKAIQFEPPQIALEKYPENDKLKLLVSLCRELQRAVGNSAFFLSARTAARLLDSYPMQVSRWLWLLESDDILRVVSKGKMTADGGIATRFRYIAS